MYLLGRKQTVSQIKTLTRRSRVQHIHGKYNDILNSLLYKTMEREAEGNHNRLTRYQFLRRNYRITTRNTSLIKDVPNMNSSICYDYQIGYTQRTHNLVIFHCLLVSPLGEELCQQMFVIPAHFLGGYHLHTRGVAYVILHNMSDVHRT